jgi:NAD(P)-dependent dehydrogenase (short-subunit alcohol dehydrogenase family)
MTTSPPGTPIDGAVALITGSHRGFGRALVDALLACGATKVYATSRSPQPPRDERIVPLVLDVTYEASVSAAADAAHDVSIVVTNAGIALGTDAPIKQGAGA